MNRKPLKFRHVVIDPDPPGTHHDITLRATINSGGVRSGIPGFPRIHLTRSTQPLRAESSAFW